MYVCVCGAGTSWKTEGWGWEGSGLRLGLGERRHIYHISSPDDIKNVESKAVASEMYYLGCLHTGPNLSTVAFRTLSICRYGIVLEPIPISVHLQRLW